MTLNVLLFKATLLVYFAATILYLVSVISRKEAIGKSAKWVLIGGFATHCLALASRWVATGLTPATSLF